MRQPHPFRPAFTLVEVLTVVVILAILAGVVIPEFTVNGKAAKESAARFNLRDLRSRIELYRQHHDGKLPSAALIELTAKTNAAGSIGTSSAHRFGPYCAEIPVSPLTDSAVVRVAASNPPSAAGGAEDAGWLYHPPTGGIWIDDEELLTE